MLKNFCNKHLVIFADLSVLCIFFLRKNIISLIKLLCPECFFYKKFGFICPSCGGTRCLSYISQGNFTSAIKEHALFFILILYFLFLLILFNLHYIFNIRLAKTITLRLANIKILIFFIAFYILLWVFKLLL